MSERMNTTNRAWAARVCGSVIGAVGFLLSPLSWWNDLYVNLPLAYLVAHAFRDDLFLPALIAAYWASNIFGLALLHWGATAAITGRVRPLSRGDALRWLLISLGYTLGVLSLARMGFLRPFGEWLN